MKQVGSLCWLIFHVTMPLILAGFVCFSAGRLFHSHVAATVGAVGLYCGFASPFAYIGVVALILGVQGLMRRLREESDADKTDR